MTTVEEIQQYLSETQKLGAFAVNSLLEKYQNHADIVEEFASVIKTGIYPDNGAMSGDWTAKNLHEKLPHLPDYTIYEFLAGLRDHPEEYKQFIAEGAPIL